MTDDLNAMTVFVAVYHPQRRQASAGLRALIGHFQAERARERE